MENLNLSQCQHKPMKYVKTRMHMGCQNWEIGGSTRFPFLTDDKSVRMRKQLPTLTTLNVYS